jgi:hypothetical protein
MALRTAAAGEGSDGRGGGPCRDMAVRLWQINPALRAAHNLHKAGEDIPDHCHGDHSFGLPGLLSLLGTDRTRDDPPVKIHGQKDSWQLKF